MHLSNRNTKQTESPQAGPPGRLPHPEGTLSRLTYRARKAKRASFLMNMWPWSLTLGWNP